MKDKNEQLKKPLEEKKGDKRLEIEGIKAIP